MQVRRISQRKNIYDKWIKGKRSHKGFSILFSAVLMGVILAVATLISFELRRLDIHESNIIMTYLLAVLFSAYLLEGYMSSLVASVLGVLTFNYFFTVPYYSLAAYRPDYPFTFVFMFVAALMMSTLTLKVKQEAKISHLREKRANLLYHISQRLLYVNKAVGIADVIGEDVSKVMGVRVLISLCDESGDLDRPRLYDQGEKVSALVEIPSHQLSCMNEVMRKRVAKVSEKKFYDDHSVYYVPVSGQTGNFGVLGFTLETNETLNDEKKEIGMIISSLMAMAIERELLSEQRKTAAVRMESEQLRGNLLRAISHDLRTPLTGILGATATLIERGDFLSEVQKMELLNNTYDEAKWLIHTVENILRLTQIDEGHMKLNVKKEFVEEIFAEVVARTMRQVQKHKLEVVVPEELIMVPMDGHLIEHVLINLIDNAVKYTPEGSKIKLSADYNEVEAHLSVSDNGGGISQKAMNKIFNRFVTDRESWDRGKHGIGLGLEICKAIVEAHAGTIQVQNNKEGGATFRISLPLKEVIK